MSRALERLFVYGFPSLYGGAGTELHHQIAAWGGMGMEIHLIPTNGGYRQEALYDEMIGRGVIIHEANDWGAIEAGDPVFGFCNAEFLDSLEEIHARSRRTIFANCMTWLFDKERECMAKGLIGMFIYQNEAVRRKNMPELKALNDDPGIRFVTFRAHFDARLFPFQETRSDEYFGCGRISRQDADKFAANTLHIYEYFVAPKWKSGLFLGFDRRSEKKIGAPFEWIRTVGGKGVRRIFLTSRAHEPPRIEHTSAGLHHLFQSLNKPPPVLDIQDNVAPPVPTRHGVANRSRILHPPLPWHA